MCTLMVFAPFNSFCRRLLLTIQSTEYHFAHVTVFFAYVTEICFYQFQDGGPIRRLSMSSTTVLNQKRMVLFTQTPDLLIGHYTYNKLLKIVIASRMQFTTNLTDLAIMCHAAGCIMFRILQKLR
jgi:hypothetical protein